MWSRTRATLVLFAVAASLGFWPLAVAAQDTFTCTEALGFSQSLQWFTGRSLEGGQSPEDYFDSSTELFLEGWQGRFTFGAAIERWMDTSYVGWEGQFTSPMYCERNQVERVVFNVSGEARSVSDWVSAIDSVVVLVRSRYPEVEQILLQPVVGAPEGQCEEIRAARNHLVVLEAIRRVAEGGRVTAGAAPTVARCNRFADSLGHLTAEGALHVREQLREHYRRVSGP